MADALFLRDLCPSSALSEAKKASVTAEAITDA
jgi:hypothetical protein